MAQLNITPQPGDHLISQRINGLYTHHGIYIGNGKVIHYAGLSGNSSTNSVSMASLSEFANGNLVQIQPHPHAKYSPTQIIERAQSRLNEDNYNVFTNNCEHFVHWCIEGYSHSHQVHRAADTLLDTLIDDEDLCETAKTLTKFCLHSSQIIHLLTQTEENS